MHLIFRRRNWRHLGKRSEFGDYELMEYTDKDGNKCTEYREIF